jgi:phage-related minor tail protein
LSKISKENENLSSYFLKLETRMQEDNKEIRDENKDMKKQIDDLVTLTATNQALIKKNIINTDKRMHNNNQGINQII